MKALSVAWLAAAVAAVAFVELRAQQACWVASVGQSMESNMADRSHFQALWKTPTARRAAREKGKGDSES